MKTLSGAGQTLSTINDTTNAAAGTSVTITLQASPATWTLTANVLTDGSWSVIPTSVLPNGVSDALGTLTDAAGNSGCRT